MLSLWSSALPLIGAPSGSIYAAKFHDGAVGQVPNVFGQLATQLLLANFGGILAYCSPPERALQVVTES